MSNEFNENDIKSDNEALATLTAPIKISFYRKILDFLTHPVARFAGHKILTLLFILIISFSTALLTLKLVDANKKDFQRLNAEDFSPTKYYEYLRQKHIEYKKLNSAELMVRWIEMFKDYTYQRDGNPKYKQTDCSGAVEAFLFSWGANVSHYRVTQMISNFSVLEKQSLNKKRENYNDVESGDLIFIQLEKNQPEHVGIIVKKINHYYQVVDVNAKLGGMGIYDLQYNDKKIYGIYETGLAYWLGSLFTTLNRGE